MPKGERGIFGTNIDPRQAQAKGVEARKANKERLAAIRDTLNIRPITQQEIDEWDSMLLSCTRRQLAEVVQNEELPLVMRNRARLLLGKAGEITALDSFGVEEKMRDRCFGKPVQKVDAQVQAAPAPIIADVFAQDE